MEFTGDINNERHKHLQSSPGKSAWRKYHRASAARPERNIKSLKKHAIKLSVEIVALRGNLLNIKPIAGILGLSLGTHSIRKKSEGVETLSQRWLTVCE